MSKGRGDISVAGPVVVCAICNKSVMAAEYSVEVAVVVDATAAVAVVVEVSGDEMVAVGTY